MSMPHKLAYRYVGSRFPNLSGTEVIVYEMSQIANIDYKMLQNRMGMKRLRSQTPSEVVMTDSDIVPRKRSSTAHKRTPGNQRMQARLDLLSHQWLKKKLV